MDLNCCLSMTIVVDDEMKPCPVVRYIGIRSIIFRNGFLIKLPRFFRKITIVEKHIFENC